MYSKNFLRPSLANERRNGDRQDLKERCFVQNFEDLSEEELKVDKIEKTLGFLCLR